MSSFQTKFCTRPIFKYLLCDFPENLSGIKSDSKSGYIRIDID